MAEKKGITKAVLGDPSYGLTPKQRAFVENIIQGMQQTTAARAAGYAEPRIEAIRLMKNAQVVEAVRHLQGKYEQAAKMTRKRVMDGLIEAVEMAKVQGEPGVMVQGWREIGKICGYYAAERKEISVNITAKRAINKLETLSDEELLEMVERDSAAIEGEFSEVLGADEPEQEDDAA